MIHPYKYPVEIGEKVTSQPSRHDVTNARFIKKLDHLPRKPFKLHETRRSYLSNDILFVSDRNLSVNQLLK